MSNREVARTFNKLAKVMELHGENPFKIRSYANAYNTIRRYPDEVMDLSRQELMEIKGIGKNIADKIEELKATGNISTLQKLLDITPPGVVDLLSIKGFGAKKILAVWKELGVESPGELLYACEENRLVDLKGFGSKSQENLSKQLIYFLDAQGKYLYGHIIDEATELLNALNTSFNSSRFEFINDIRRQMPIIESIEIIGTEPSDGISGWLQQLDGISMADDICSFKGTRVTYTHVSSDEVDKFVFEHSASDEFLDEWSGQFGNANIAQNEKLLFNQLGIEFIPPESRETGTAISRAKLKSLQLITMSDIRGVVHAHSTYSDGANSVSEMANASQKAGYQYLVISDHSKSAFYANGLQEDRIFQQMAEIDELNAVNADFKIFKGIECDILYDGQLDYSEDLLSQFEVIIASVHAHLKMDITKATDRIITAVNNKYTRILGHPTGRLLLSREGYPIDHMAVIDACADNGVVIELNANPYRLDLDWTWIPYAIEKKVMISINPDAHNIGGISDIHYGVSAARKALLRSMDCLNSMDLDNFSNWVNNK